MSDGARVVTGSRRRGRRQGRRGRVGHAAVTSVGVGCLVAGMAVGGPPSAPVPARAAAGGTRAGS
eukprot:scaffold11032_cov51-Phaeocystis_antarctica.AAC.2